MSPRRQRTQAKAKASAPRDRKREDKAPHRSPSAILDRIAEAFSIIATATSALQSAEDPTVIEDAAESGDKIACLVHGVAELRRALSEVSVLKAVKP